MGGLFGGGSKAPTDYQKTAMTTPYNSSSPANAHRFDKTTTATTAAAAPVDTSAGDGIPTGTAGDLKMSPNDIKFIKKNQDRLGNASANRASSVLSSGAGSTTTGTKTLLG